MSHDGFRLRARSAVMCWCFVFFVETTRTLNKAVGSATFACILDRIARAADPSMGSYQSRSVRSCLSLTIRISPHFNTKYYLAVVIPFDASHG